MISDVSKYNWGDYVPSPSTLVSLPEAISLMPAGFSHFAQLTKLPK